MGTAKRTRRNAPPARPVRKKPETLRLRSATPSLTVNDLAASVAWYRDVVGFVVEQEWKDDAGAPHGAMVKAGTVRFMLGQDDFAKGRDRKKGEGFRVYCATVQDVDQLAANIKARGGTLAQEPRTMPWGSRMFAVTDPDGFKITFANDG